MSASLPGSACSRMSISDELDLAQRLQAAVEVLRREHAVEQRARQRLARVDVGGQALQHVPLPAEVLHELARQLDRVPLDAGDAGDADVVDARQHVVQAVAELVEQRGDVVVRQQRRLALERRREVADEVRDRRLQAALGPRPALAHVVHPRARALARARVGVEPELADEFGRAVRGGRRARCGRSARSGARPSRSSGRMRTSNSVSTMRNRPSSTVGSVKYCFTSWSLKA